MQMVYVFMFLVSSYVHVLTTADLSNTAIGLCTYVYIHTYTHTVEILSQ